MALAESIPCKESSVSLSKAWRITGRGGMGDRNYRVGLETDQWVSSGVQMVTREPLKMFTLSLFFLENGGRAILREFTLEEMFL